MCSLVHWCKFCIFRRSNCVVTASGIVTLRKQLFNAPVESGLQSKHVEDYNVIHINLEYINYALSW